jgi:hypothetical protein
MREASAVMRSPEARAALEAFVGGDSAEDDPVVELRG